jgi:hypothetical protein
MLCIPHQRDAYRVLMGKLEGRRPLGRLRLRWVNNIKWIFEKWIGGGGGMDWIPLAQNRAGDVVF